MEARLVSSRFYAVLTNENFRNDVAKKENPPKRVCIDGLRVKKISKINIAELEV
jgi:hypothetical protein